jgi:putative ABC transport system ATP-binding protein
MKENIITATNISKVYRRGSEKIDALKNVNFCIPRGEYIAIVGPSGSGKTTLLNLLGCLDNPSGGSITVNGVEASKLPESQLVDLRRKNIGFIFQQFFLLPTLSVRENIALPLLFSRRNHSAGRIQQIIEMVGLKDRAEHLPGQLSGGEMQRVAIGRALVNEPKIILADEPTGNLDSATAEKIFELFRQLCSNGISLIVVTHNQELAKMAHGMISMKDGEITAMSECLRVVA